MNMQLWKTLCLGDSSNDNWNIFSLMCMRVDWRTRFKRFHTLIGSKFDPYGWCIFEFLSRWLWSLGLEWTFSSFLNYLTHFSFYSWVSVLCNHFFYGIWESQLQKWFWTAAALKLLPFLSLSKASFIKFKTIFFPVQFHIASGGMSL